MPLIFLLWRASLFVRLIQAFFTTSRAYQADSVTADFSVTREFAITERARLQIRGEVFSAFNRTNLNPPVLPSTLSRSA